MASEFEGVWTALVTPMKSTGDIDWKSFEALIHSQIEAKVTGVVPCGTTGESPTLDEDEKKELILKCIQWCAGSDVKVMAGTGSNDTRQSVAFSKWASDQGVAACLVVNPYYNRPSFPGLKAHYLAIAESTKCPIMVYHVPGRTQLHLKADDLVSLAALPRLSGLKEATGNVAFASEILECARKRSVKIDLLSGDDVTFWPLLAVGSTGIVSVASNVIPKEMVALYRAAKEGRFSDGLAIHQKYYPFFRDLFLEANPVPVKQALEDRGAMEGQVRLPLARMSEPTLVMLRTTMKRCGL